MNDSDFQAILERARGAQKIWACASYSERARVLRRVEKKLIANIDGLIDTVHSDNGKLKLDALAAELLPALLAIRFYIRRGRRFIAPRKIRAGSILMFNKKSRLVHEPWGVVGIISPWNYPFSIPFSEIVMALLAGNAVIFKGASRTAKIGEALAALFDSAGLPDGLFGRLEMRGEEAGAVLIGSAEKAGVDKLFFTGSSAAGKKLMAAAAPRLLPLVLELGGADAAIICKDANLDRAAAGIVWAGFSNAGQSCGGVQRVIVHSAIYEAFLRKLKALTQKLRAGIDLGPMISFEQKRAVRSQINAALEAGAQIAAISGGASFEDESLEAPAVVLTDIEAGSPVLNEEIFGPVVAVISVKDDEEAVKMANDSAYALTASVWSKNRRRARALSSRINAGAVMINDHLMSHGLAETPWGGFGASGFGKTHGEQGFMEMLKTKVIVDDMLPAVRRDIFWQPYSDNVFQGIKALCAFVSGSFIQRIKAISALIKIFLRYWEK